MTHLTLDQIWLNTYRVGLIVNIFNLINIKLQQLICYSIKTKDINTFDINFNSASLINTV